MKTALILILPVMFALPFFSQPPEDRAAIFGSSPAPLPHSMKGYELYSWPGGEDWHFCLITGTNRLKSVEEVTGAPAHVSGAGLVRISVVGQEALKSQLARLPSGEEIVWSGGDLLAGTGRGKTRPLALPPRSIVAGIESWAARHHLKIRTDTSK